MKRLPFGSGPSLYWNGFLCVTDLGLDPVLWVVECTSGSRLFFFRGVRPVRLEVPVKRTVHLVPDPKVGMDGRTDLLETRHSLDVLTCPVIETRLGVLKVCEVESLDRLGTPGSLVLIPLWFPPKTLHPSRE